MNIIVTGASQGIGFEVVKELAKESHHQIIAIARKEEKLLALQKACLPTTIQIIPFDLANGCYANLIATIVDKIGQVDILINNAGFLVNKPFTELTLAATRLMFEVNVLSPFRLIQGLHPHFQSPAHIVNIGSMGGFQGSVKFAGLTAYSASKAALANLTESLAVELAADNIKVNCLALGAVQTEMLTKAFPLVQAPITAQKMAVFIANFALTGHQFFNGKVLPVALSTP